MRVREKAMDKRVTVNILEKGKCTGCGSCKNICPVSAIEMKDNGEGFLYPYIDEKLCVECGLCYKHCPELNQDKVDEFRTRDPQVYAMMAEKSVRETSSSGGMFTVLANHVIDQGGYVCGAVYSDDYQQIYHAIVSEKEELWRIRGSKYVQSNTKDTYSQLKRYLDENKPVLFTGCPCQVAGFKTFLGREYEKLITADIVCHGVPSPEIYRKYISEKAQGRKIVKVDFREKTYWGWGTATSLFFEDGSTYRGDCFTDEYWLGFLGGMETRKCCGDCSYANPKRVGDFTIGDFWGVSDIDQTLSDGKGTSLVMVNNSKAHKILRKVSNDCVLLQKIDLERTLELAKTRNGQLLHPTRSHWARDRFFELCKNHTLVQSFTDARNNNYDVGITGWWYNENYGGTLTYYALNRVLHKMGLTVLMIAKCSWDKDYKPQYDSVPYRFAMKNYNISKNYTPETIHVLNDHCKTFISGSDQLFNPTLWEYSGPQYFLNYVSSKNNIISYASSFGNGFVDNKNLKIQMSYWLHRFDALSVRENYGKDICQEVFGLHADLVMDPVFLCDVEEYRKQAEKSGLKKEENYLLNFILDPNQEKRELILNISKKLNLPFINMLNAMDYDRNAEILNLENTKKNVDIEEWLFYYMNSDFVITDSFHGTCFAIIFRKNFISLANYQRGERRFASLLEEVGLKDRLVYDLNEIENRPELFQPINYDEVYRNIEPKIKASYEWLENAIKRPQAKEMNLFNILNCEIEKLKLEIEKIKSR